MIDIPSGVRVCWDVGCLRRINRRTGTWIGNFLVTCESTLGIQCPSRSPDLCCRCFWAERERQREREREAEENGTVRDIDDPFEDREFPSWTWSYWNKPRNLISSKIHRIFTLLLFPYKKVLIEIQIERGVFLDDRQLHALYTCKVASLYDRPTSTDLMPRLVFNKVKTWLHTLDRLRSQLTFRRNSKIKRYSSSIPRSFLLFFQTFFNVSN